MPSGKKAKEQRRQAVPPPPVRQRGAGAGARRASPRTLAIAGGVIVLVIVGIVLAIVLSQGGSSSTNGGNGDGDGPTIAIADGMPAIGSSTSGVAYTDAATVESLFKGIPQHGFVLGDPNAPVTLIEYIDLQCPVCKDFETNQLAPLVDKYVKTGKVKIKLQTWNIIDGHYPGDDDSLRGQKATIAAAKQNKAFDFAEILYNNQGVEGSNWMTDLVISRIASSVDGLNLSQLATDANSATTQNIINDVDAYAASQPDFTGTPTFQLSQGNGKPVFFGTGYPDLTKLETAINKLLPK